MLYGMADMYVTMRMMTSPTFTTEPRVIGVLLCWALEDY